MRVAINSNDVNNVSSLGVQIRVLLSQGLSNAAIVNLTGARAPYVRSLRSQASQRHLPKQPRQYRRRPRPQTDGELRELAITLYDWRQAGKYDT